MYPTVAIRTALSAEAETLADIGYVAWDRDLRPFLAGAAASREVQRERLDRDVATHIARIIVADVDGVATGWCMRARGLSYIPYLFVTPLLQNQGIGSMLLRRMETIFELEGAGYVQLDTLADNVRAVTFYQRQGYRILALKPQGRVAGDTTMSVRLEKPLSPYRGQLDE
ncbi:Acetyltransferase (GNAT) family protein [Devosia enhydra]|uniref:Acetyltransferase (GNAT) family protein n=1 Tax=Devosia enhydra TaxID=665118 RepID=A0A1K2HUM1_9HYPH|nr:GNAT family N-acetyltransferase [Devosia enhydra]SFZ81988.1 Acetyltransferase (GNAT) family protein [Devosia enhydra]